MSKQEKKRALSDPSSGEAHMLMVKSDLSVANQLDHTGWGTNQALSPGWFGLPTVSAMLYDPQ